MAEGIAAHWIWVEREVNIRVTSIQESVLTLSKDGGVLSGPACRSSVLLPQVHTVESWGVRGRAWQLEGLHGSNKVRKCRQPRC